jgi:hypothetical protein
VPKKEALKKKILDEAYTSKYFIHPDSTKMYHDLREHFIPVRTYFNVKKYAEILKVHLGP